ncbi:MAG: hypothetical protein LBD01_03055 [Puniceicoccales bacterium]|jgi:hypothetical protein|nr:hypothetical protein [Puniceicoccales bacterium]
MRYTRVAIPAPLRRALLFAILAHALVFLLANPVVTFVKMENAPPTTRFSMGRPSGESTNIALDDWKPLYLPTLWNYGQDAPGHSMTELDIALGETPLGAFAPMLRVEEGVPLPLFDEGEEAAQGPTLDALFALSFWNVAATLGRQPVPDYAPTLARQAFMRVEDATTGRTVFEKAISLGLSAEEVGVVWEPAAFSYWVDLHGVVGAAEPLPLEAGGHGGSGNATVDNAMRLFLANAGLAARLGPGHYRVLIGP